MSAVQICILLSSCLVWSTFYYYTSARPVIAKRRIGHSAEDIRDFILATDLDGLLPEYCELLLKFIPTQEEVCDS